VSRPHTSDFRALAQLPSLRWALGVATVTGLVLCAIPLFGTLGPEAALVLGVVLPPFAGAVATRITLKSQGRQTASSVLLCRAIACAWMLLALPVSLLGLNALRFKTCEPFSGLSFIALGPLAGVTLAAVIGVTIGALGRHPRLLTTLSLLVPISAVVRALYDFIATPGIFAFGHFFGYFPGTFYDRRIEIPDTWLSQRACSLLVGAGLWALVIALRDRKTGRLSIPRGVRHPGVLLLSVLCLLGAAYEERKALQRAQRTSTALVMSRLGLAIDSARCRVVVPRELDLLEAHRLAQDCDFRVGQLETRLGVREDQRITAFFFRSANEKRALMGAARVYIAKPWRREVYLQLAEFPHPVLAHELAHVVARHAASGPFGVAGHLYGLIPEPTLVEGLAVALEPTARDELTSHQWARAAQDAQVAPSLQSLLGASFLSQNQALAYTLAGSFLQHVLDTRGSSKVREIYRRGDVPSVLGASWQNLEAEWKQALRKVPMPAHAKDRAQARFERPGVFSQVCPHTVERLDAELAGALSAGDEKRAIEKSRAVLEIDPNDTGTRATLVGTLARAGELEAASKELSRLTGPRAAAMPVIARARLGIADAAMQRGDAARAAAGYRALLREALPEAELRQIEVKLLGLDDGDNAGRWIAELLIGHSGRAADTRVAMHAIHEIAKARDDGLGAYLEARQLSAAGRHDLAFPLFRHALSRGLATRRLRDEAMRMLARSAFDAGAFELAGISFEALLERSDQSLAERIEARDWLDRIEFVKQR